MMRLASVSIAGCVAVLAAAGLPQARVGAQQPSSSTTTEVSAPSATTEPRALLDRYCVTCHNERLQTGGLALDTLDLSDVAHDAAVWEKVVRKLRGGVMPPVGRPRPDSATYAALVSWFEAELDGAAAVHPNPGRTEAFHRLNRAEYQNAVRDLLEIEFDVAELLPGDDSSYGFDNIAGVLRFSPTLMERYLIAAQKVSRAAVGGPPPFPNFDVFRVADDLPQDDRLDDLPFGTRGGVRIRYNFPADGEYAVRVRLARQLGGQDRDVPRFHTAQQLEVSLDRAPLQVFTLAAAQPRARGRRPTPPGPPSAEPSSRPTVAAAPQGEQPARGAGQGGNRNRLDADWEFRFAATAGPHDVGVTFINRTPALLETLVQPYLYPKPQGSNQWSSRRGAYLRTVEISGPFEVTGVSDTPSRRRIFVCHPADPSEEAGCANTILSTLARRAYRRPVTDAEIEALLTFYNDGRADGDFERGIELALRGLLVSPGFLFRIERDPAEIAPDTDYRISDLELASRLSFFLWSSIPDDELLEVAMEGTLAEPAVLDRQVRRMLADSRSAALVDNFVGQWLQLRRVPTLAPDPFKDPDFDESLRRALRRETELFLDSIIRDDRSVLELLEADYTFLNERLARHYGVPHVYGSHFRRVALPEGSVRGGLLGQGSVLAVTSHANRTSPVVRGKWILENILGTPPPEAPANVPPLEEEQDGGQALTMRERMEEHRANPICASCHLIMDPLGLALENFDQAGRWRPVEESFNSRVAAFTPIDTVGTLPDGTTFDGPVEMRQALLSRSDNFVATLTEKLLTYALGRGAEHYDMPAVRAITRDAARNDHRFSSLVLGIVRSVPFQMRRSES